MAIRQTHTYAELLVPAEVYDVVARKLREAGYDHAFMEDGTIDMHGIGLCAPCSYCTNREPCENCMNTGRQRG